MNSAYFKFSKSEGLRITQIPALWGVKSLNICKKHQHRERNRYLSYQIILAGLACQFPYLHVFYIKRTVKNITKVLCLYINAPVRTQKIRAVLRYILAYFSIIQPFQILIWRLSNISNKALRKKQILGSSKCGKS